MKPLHINPDDAETLSFPGAIEFRVLISGDKTDNQFAVFEDIVEPGIGPARHIHKDQDETFFVIEGTFDVEVGGKLIHLAPGNVAFVPRGTIHAFKNVGTTKGRLRYLFTPAGNFEEMVREMFAIGGGAQPSEEELNKIALQHGQQFVGDPL